MLDMRIGRSTFVMMAFLAACAGRDSGETDTAATSGGTTAAMTSAAPPSDNRPAPRDAEHEFLRKMIDHHEGLIQMATAAMTKASTSATQGDAHNLHTKQADEQKKMIADVQSQYGETVTPMVMPEHKAMADSLASKAGAEYDRTFYRLVVQHHREAVQMVDDMRPRFTKSEVRSMAEKMKADQQKEITEFQRKGGA